jgi:SAM-dependent methyltransferase
MTDPSHPALYASPEIYDVAFGWDLALELDFLESCFTAHVEGPVRRILEPACGTGRLLNALAGRGYDVLGYDLSPEMVAFTSRRLGAHGGRALRGDMAAFRPPGRFDVAINLVNSIGYLLEDEPLLQHFERIAEALRPGGIYIAQFNYWGEPPELATFGPWGNRKNDLSTTLTWTVVREDVEAKRSHQHARITARRGKEKLTLEEDHVLRLWTQEDVDDLLERSPLRLAAVYHDRFDPFPIDVPRTGEHGNLYHVLAHR